METLQKHDSAFSGTSIEACYQCGKCTGGCPVASLMDLMPNQLMRLVQLGKLDKALASTAIWHCVSCQTCTTRCPQSVDCAGVMDVLRQMSAELGKAAPQLRRVLVFQKAFLDNVRRNGRLNEVELIGFFKTMAFLKDFNIPLLMKDTLLAPQLLQRGKLHILGEKVRDRGVVRRIFDRCMTSPKPFKDSYYRVSSIKPDERA